MDGAVCTGRRMDCVCHCRHCRGVAATSNGANLTDGLDGLCAGTSAIICVALAIMAYLGGNSHLLDMP